MDKAEPYPTGMLFDPAAAEDDVAIVEDRSLSRRDGALCVVEADFDTVRYGGGAERGGGGGWIE